MERLDAASFRTTATKRRGRLGLVEPARRRTTAVSRWSLAELDVVAGLIGEAS